MKRSTTLGPTASAWSMKRWRQQRQRIAFFSSIWDFFKEMFSPKDSAKVRLQAWTHSAAAPHLNNGFQTTANKQPELKKVVEFVVEFHLLKSLPDMSPTIVRREHRIRIQY